MRMIKEVATSSPWKKLHYYHHHFQWVVVLLLMMAVWTTASSPDSDSSSISTSTSTVAGLSNTKTNLIPIITTTSNNRTNSIHNSTDVHDYYYRELQSTNRLWDIGKPNISWVGMEVGVDYTVRDQVVVTDVSVTVFRDAGCTWELADDDNNFMVTDIINDLTPFGDGTGTRVMTVTFNIDARNVQDSRIIIYTDSATAILSFCARFSLHDPANPLVAVNSRDTPIVVGMDLDNLKLTGLIEDDEANYGAEAFECDENNYKIGNPPSKNQGSIIRICVQPNAYARDAGVVMKSINSFRFQRGDVEQQIIKPDGVNVDIENTVYRCTPGEPVCWFTAVISNGFYYSAGQVGGTGVAWLQYQFGGQGSGTRQRNLQVPIQLLRSQPNQNQQQQQQREMAYEAGGFIGERTMEMTFSVNPSDSTYKAVAYQCSNQNLPLTPQEAKQPKGRGDSIRVCVTPDEEARKRGVQMRGINNFFWQQGEKTQFSVTPGGVQEDGTLLICNSGESLCAFKTELMDGFFKSNDAVKGTGEVYLQFGTELISRRTQVVFQQDHRRESNTIVDAAFAGSSDVLVVFHPDPTLIPQDELTWQEKAEQWWLNTPLFLRVVYILALILAFLILLCFLWAICCGNPFDYYTKRRRVVEEKTTTKEEPQVVVQPPIYANAPDADDREVDADTVDEHEEEKPAAKERDFRDSLDNPEGYHYEEPDADARSIPPVPESEPVDFGPTSPKPSVRRLEADTFTRTPSKSPKRKNSKSPKRNASKSPKRTTSKSPKREGSKKKLNAAPFDDESFAASVRSPRPGRKREASVGSMRSQNPSGGGSVGKSPKRAQSLMSPQPSGGGSVKSPKRASSMMSPQPSGGGSVGKSPKRATSLTSPQPSGDGSVGKSPKPKRKGSSKSPKGRRASLDGTPKKTPRGSRKTATNMAGEQTTPTMPSDLPF